MSGKGGYSNMSLNGRWALVTGGARNIGRAICLALAGAGCNVCLWDLAAEDGENMRKDLIAQGVEAVFQKVNVADFVSVDEAMDKFLSQSGRLDVLVNNAGITRDNLLLRMSEEDWDSVLSTNLKSVYNCCKSALRTMLRQRAGRIINIASVVGVAGNAGQTNYAASKAGIIGFTKSLAREVASRGITVNAVAPGYIATDMTAKLSPKQQEAIRQQIPLQRMGTPEDVAAVVAFLASPQAEYITGQTLHVDGGLVM